MLRLLDGWSLVGVFIALLVVIPIATVFWLALFPAENIWPHLISTTLPRYLRNSVLMMLGVGGLAGALGTLTAWLVVSVLSSIIRFRKKARDGQVVLDTIR